MIVQARKLLEAIQHSTLDRLPMFLVQPVLLFCSALSLVAPSQAEWPAFIFGLLFGTLLLGVFSYWLLGRIARTEIRGEPVPHRMSNGRNGFEAWDTLPPGGLRPPLWLRQLHLTLGADPAPSIVFILWIVSLTSFLTALAVVAVPNHYWLEYMQLDMTDQLRMQLLGLAFVGLLAFSLCRWAANTAPHLAPEP